MRRMRRLGGAALASLVIHVGLLLLLGSVDPPERAPRRAVTSKPLAVDIVTTPPVLTPPPPPRQPAPSASTPRPKGKQVRKTPAGDGLVAAPSPAPLDAPDTGAAPETIASPPDAPRRPQQLQVGAEPLPSFLVPGGAPLDGPRTPSGRTLRPGDPAPSREQLAAQEEAIVAGRVEEFIVDEQAQLRVANGLIDPYFSRLREALEKGLEDAPVFPGTSLVNQAGTAWASRASSFGAAGNPGDGPPPKAPTTTERLYDLQQRAGDESMERPRLLAHAGQELQHLATGGGSKLVVTLELTQEVDGTLRDAKLVSLSGNPAYDAYVLNAIPASLAKLAAPPAGARGVRADGIRTLWAVEGRVVYLRKLKELKGQDAWYIAATSAAGILAGRFEETTGEIEVIDFRNPRFVCRSHLLRVY
ncbi:hypothetical protein MVI01_06590 [Myxococcus virescens]|uniref:TonB C-terminal domain-containing protein n=2 Tax=Myxococcus virescens TaxID=83456 RepID=A0A511H5U3_9BACT|nr:hypothetical protein MVI01_06590 [Myxococcus virescens]